MSELFKSMLETLYDLADKLETGEYKLLAFSNNADIIIETDKLTQTGRQSFTIVVQTKPAKQKKISAHKKTTRAKRSR